MCRSSSFPRADVTGGHFSAHIDGPWVPSAKRASMFTVVIYLNDARSQPPCVGGHTNFLRPAIITPQAQRITESAAAESHIARCAHHGCLFWAICAHSQVNSETRSQQEHNVVYSVEPKTGSAVVFRHELLHEVLQHHACAVPLVRVRTWV